MEEDDDHADEEGGVPDGATGRMRIWSVTMSGAPHEDGPACALLCPPKKHTY